MSRTGGWRATSLTGAAAAAVLYVGLSAFGDTPDPGDPAPQVTAYFTANRVGIRVGVVLVGVALLGLVAVVVRLDHLLRDAGHGGAGTLMVSSATVAAGAVAVGLLLPYVGLTSGVGAEAPGFGKGVFILTVMLTPIVAVPLAALTAATGIALHRAGIGSAWFARASVVVAAVLVVSACSFASDGYFSADVQQQVVFTVLTGWLLASTFGTRTRGGARVPVVDRGRLAG